MRKPTPKQVAGCFTSIGCKQRPVYDTLVGEFVTDADDGDDDE